MTACLRPNSLGHTQKKKSDLYSYSLEKKDRNPNVK